MKQQTQQQRKELPLLAGIAGLIRWVEELANLVAGPLLTLGLGIALVDLLTEGKLLASVPALLFTWAITQAIGVDAQLVALWDKAHIALSERRYGALVALVVLGLVLAYVAWIAAQVFALQESEGLTTAAALARLGLDSSLWLVQRTALSVFLVCLAGWSRYHAPAADVAAETAAERARLEADLALEPLRQQKRAMQARGLRSVVAAAVGHDETPPRLPTGPGSPSQKPARYDTLISPPPNVVTMPAPRKRTTRRKVARGASARSAPISAEGRARRAYKPGMSAGELSRAANIGISAASKWRKVLEAEQSGQAAQ